MRLVIDTKRVEGHQIIWNNMRNNEVVNNNSVGLTDLEMHIFNTLVEVRDEYKRAGKKSVSWITNELKKKIGELGYINGFQVASSVDDGEWLYDLIWYKNSEKGHLEKLVLSLESELSNRNINSLKCDYEKLLCSNSDYRIFICFGKGNYSYPKNVNELLVFFNEGVNSYANLKKNDRLLILVWEDYMHGEIHPHLILKD